MIREYSGSASFSTLALRLQAHKTMPGFNMGVRDVNLGPHVCAAKILYRQLSSQSYEFVFLHIRILKINLFCLLFLCAYDVEGCPILHSKLSEITGQLCGGFLSSYIYISFRDQTQVLRLVSPGHFKNLLISDSYSLFSTLISHQQDFKSFLVSLMS